MSQQLAEEGGGAFWSCSDADVAQFWEDGYLIVPELFRPDEAELLHRVSKAEPNGQPDEDGVQPIMWLFSTRDAADKEDMFNAVVHSRRMVETMMRLLGDEVYVYHYKMAMKQRDNPVSDLDTNGEDTGRNNEWVWHQDYVRRIRVCVQPIVLRLSVRRAHRDTGTTAARCTPTSPRASLRSTSAQKRTAVSAAAPFAPSSEV